MSVSVAFSLEFGISVMKSCVVDDRSVPTGNHSGDEGCASDGLGSPAMPPTDENLLSRLSNLASLNKAWRIVRQSALQSASLKITRLAKEFDQNSIKNLREIERALKEDAFVFKGVYARLLPRPGKNPRPLAVAPIASRIVQRAILDILWSNPKIKKRVKNKNSFGGIEKRGVKDALIEVSKCLHQGYNYYITSDISDFFQNINKRDTNNTIFSFLQDNSINELIEDSLKCEILNSTHKNVAEHIDLFPKDQIGVLQGCCLSPLYGNIFLSDFDEELNSFSGIRCIRYIDDFILLGKRQPALLKVFSKAVEILEKKGLRVYKLGEHNTKARFGDVRKFPIEFLGCSIEKGRVRPLNKARANLLKKIDECLKISVTQMNNSKLDTPIENSYIKNIFNVNNMIKGWAGAFSFCNDPTYFRSLDKDILAKFYDYHHSYQKVLERFSDPQKRQRLFGLQLIFDSTGTDPIWGPSGALASQDDSDSEDK